MVLANHAHPGRRQGTLVILRYDERVPHRSGTGQKRWLLGAVSVPPAVSSTPMTRLGQMTLATFTWHGARSLHGKANPIEPLLRGAPGHRERAPFTRESLARSLAGRIPADAK